MPRYFFDIRDCDGFHRDEFGEDCTDFDDARAQAQAILPDIAREELPDGDIRSITCEVRNEAGEMVYRGELTYRGTRDPE